VAQPPHTRFIAGIVLGLVLVAGVAMVLAALV
jgi:hypothetical protein